mmetsp:Transcript_3440/g.9925  ORF Transcript_3440/g.9925 Transcript_3440/m.9925 type:complete len:353 (-) Transcript_3440:217-1275(-)
MKCKRKGLRANVAESRAPLEKRRRACFATKRRVSVTRHRLLGSPRHAFRTSRAAPGNPVAGAREPILQFCSSRASGGRTALCRHARPEPLGQTRLHWDLADAPLRGNERPHPPKAAPSGSEPPAHEGPSAPPPLRRLPHREALRPRRGAAPPLRRGGGLLRRGAVAAALGRGRAAGHLPAPRRRGRKGPLLERPQLLPLLLQGDAEPEDLPLPHSQLLVHSLLPAVDPSLPILLLPLRLFPQLEVAPNGLCEQRVRGDIATLLTRLQGCRALSVADPAVRQPHRVLHDLVLDLASEASGHRRQRLGPQCEWQIVAVAARGHAGGIRETAAARRRRAVEGAHAMRPERRLPTL